MSLFVLYLARGMDGGAKATFDFFRSYMAVNAGCNHHLGVIFKGWDQPEEKEIALNLARLCNAQIFDFIDDGYDWGAYIRIMPYIDSYDEICFLNTFSRPLVNDWLRLLSHALNNTENGPIGAAGATGSWESYLQWPNANFFSGGIRQRLKFFRNYLRFKPYPNYHLRSNAFICKKSIFNLFSKSLKIPKTKFDALLLESGRKGFSAFLLGMGYKLIVVGADGSSYAQEEWDKSKTFRSGGQLNLVVSDNRTAQYDEASLVDKIRLRTLTWGSSSGPI
ncbi:hypothetical protein DCO17_01660 [Polynucleobacter tropicus]|uniref:Uncharacterized protein n=1 Tax=Polynucleobacter tropicus TaxID=1743174 RepID=A0A6M9PYI9_9BURK|nr:hypothetical protein [Polynucleobacter tropicus]QKM64047.1 hypothetical protein DCO17_01660 [Polynucleobacter tropicus]